MNKYDLRISKILIKKSMIRIREVIAEMSSRRENGRFHLQWEGRRITLRSNRRRSNLLGQMACFH